MDAGLWLMIGTVWLGAAWQAYRLGVQTERLWWTDWRRMHYR